MSAVDFGHRKGLREFMAQSRNSVRRGPDRSIVTALWIVAAFIFVLGGVFRMAASEWSGYHLRITGVYLLAIGMGVAILAWVSERVVARRVR
jgi:hypothetical protein